ncbi:MAG: disulfide bond formation protein B [Gaiellales bacterium]
MTDDRRLQLVLWLNAAAVVASVGLVWGAFGIQIFDDEAPCPLCLLQRLGFFAIAAGGLMNLRFGVRPGHYGITLLGSLVVIAVSLRQISLHLCSNLLTGQCTGYGAAPLGWHLYTWAFVAAIAAIVGVALLLMIPTPYVRPAKASVLTIVIFAYVGAAAIANVGATAAQCGAGICEDPPFSSSMSDPANVIDGITPGVVVPTWRLKDSSLRFVQGGAVTWATPAGNGEGKAAVDGTPAEQITITGGSGCGPDPATYKVEMADTTTLTLTPVTDGCASRKAALSGTWQTTRLV